MNNLTAFFIEESAILVIALSILVFIKKDNPAQFKRPETKIMLLLGLLIFSFLLAHDHFFK